MPGKAPSDESKRVREMLLILFEEHRRDGNHPDLPALPFLRAGSPVYYRPNTLTAKAASLLFPTGF
jgi:hypothetical protein